MLGALARSGAAMEGARWPNMSRKRLRTLADRMLPSRALLVDAWPPATASWMHRLVERLAGRCCARRAPAARRCARHGAPPPQFSWWWRRPPLRRCSGEFPAIS
ncbi:hypothetical protein F511_46101 [Dorcoceras hygrometricum]|uniref:Uncharacterized protein n=1 Tax=Dorcoceras hygrometricum TaxID=472368 RepID=A0A2Z6ZUD0_9LAMI|nr:hypothetical protein F511_46101 [Dorcoceras hygrometricum]